MRTLLAAVFLLIAAPALAFEGTYEVRGGNPDRGTGYAGMAYIGKTGEVYQILWVIKNQQYRGLGIVDGDVMAVSVPAAQQVVLYRKDPKGQLLGRWAVANQNVVAPEVLILKKAGQPDNMAPQAPTPQRQQPQPPKLNNGKPEKAT
ncbi:hypothetical protein ACFSM5_17700 [Lacibacterium aquatile]|uniref:Uncharacterized protein n=1 Tax=Lacibacterium aquatile TaxID=1168082 RepID=A0ABW5DW69_9PROT